MVRRRISSVDEQPSHSLLHNLSNLALPLRAAEDLDPLMTRIGDARVVLLGEASHGTHEFYTWRTAITPPAHRREGILVRRCRGGLARLLSSQPVRQGPFRLRAKGARSPAHLRRWPTWMWANEEVIDLIGWLRRHNADRPEEQKVGFYGLDVYSLWDSLYQVMGYLRRCPEAFAVGPPGRSTASSRTARTCRTTPGRQLYGRVLSRTEVIDLLRGSRQAASRLAWTARKLIRRRAERTGVKNAEAYYRTMVRADNRIVEHPRSAHGRNAGSLLRHHGPRAKAVVWEHNTHIGDARFTDMADEGMVNVGQLAREQYGKEMRAGRLRVLSRHRDRRRVVGCAAWAVMRVPPARDR